MQGEWSFLGDSQSIGVIVWMFRDYQNVWRKDLFLNFAGDDIDYSVVSSVFQNPYVLWN